MMRTLLLSVAMLFTTSLVIAQTPIDEDLRSGTIPSGWSASDISFETSASGYARFDETSSTLTTPVFTASAGATLEFDVAKWGSGGDGPITVRLSNDGGATFSAGTFTSTVPTSSSYQSQSFALPVGGTQLVLEFSRPTSSSRKRLRDVLVTDVAPLPVTLASFQAKAMNTSTMLEWSVASQEQNDFFAVEMSTNGRSFEQVGRVEGDGTSTDRIDYSFEVAGTTAGTYYFRLRQVDYDGIESFSNVITVSFKGKNGVQVLGPVKGGLLNVDLESDAEVTIVAITGAVVGTYQLAAGIQTIDIATVPAGIYFVTDGISTRRFVR